MNKSMKQVAQTYALNTIREYREEIQHADEYVCPCNGHSKLTFNHCQAERMLKDLEVKFGKPISPESGKK